MVYEIRFFHGSTAAAGLDAGHCEQGHFGLDPQITAGTLTYRQCAPDGSPLAAAGRVIPAENVTTLRPLVRR